MVHTGAAWARSWALVLTGVLLLGVMGRAQGGSIDIVPPHPTTEDNVVVKVSGQWGTTCPKVNYSTFKIGNTIFIQGAITDEFPMCFPTITPWSISVNLGKLPAGTYMVNVNIQGGAWSVIGTAFFQVRGVIPPPVTAVCDPQPAWPGHFTVPGSRYFATGGTDANHAYVGADSFEAITIPNALPDWGPTYAVGLWHTGDWAIYHIKTWGVTLETIRLCLSNPVTPSVGTPVEVYLFAGGTSSLVHDGNPMTAPGWVKVGSLTIYPPGTWRIYEFTLAAPFTATEYLLAVRLVEGERGPEAGKDRNVHIAWVQLIG